MSASDGLGPLPPAKCNAGSAAFAHNAETPLYTANEVRAILAKERERLLSALHRMHAEAGGHHSYYLHAATVLSKDGA